MRIRRDVTLIVLTAFGTAGLMLFAEPVARIAMHSTVIDWNSVEVKQTESGASRKFFESPTLTLERLECHATTLHKGAASHPPHQHPEEELLIVKEGVLDALVNGQWTKAGPGSVIFLASNSLHAVRNGGDGPVTYHVIQWRSSETPKSLPQNPEKALSR